MSQDPNKTDYIVEKFQAVETGQITDIATLVNSDDFKQNAGKDGFRLALEAQILAHQPNQAQAGAGIKNGYLEAFSNAFYSEMGIQKENRKGINVLNKDEREAFAQSITSPGAGFTMMGGMQATNINPLLDTLFYESPLMADITFFQDGESKEDVTDVINERVATTGSESQTGTAIDNVTVSDTLDPNNVNFIDAQEMSRLFKMVNNPTNAGMQTAKQLRGVVEQFEIALLGGIGTASRGANQFYSIFNNRAATGQNKGSLPVVFSTATGVRPVNNIDAINVVMSDFTSVFSGEDALKYKVYCNWVTRQRLVRTMDGFNRPYFDSATQSFPTLVCDPKVRVLKNMPGTTIGVWDMSKVVAKRVAPIQLQTVFDATKMVWKNYIEMYADATLRMAYKATPSKNAFRHADLKSDYTL